MEERNRMIVEAIEFHIERLLEDGLPIPEPTTVCQVVEVLSPVKLPTANR